MRFSDFLLVSNPTDLDFIVGYTDEQNIRINVLDLFAGQIIGSGTPGYVPVFTAENVIADSVIFQDGLNLVVGGEDSLGYKLAVEGSLLALDGAVIESSTPGSDTFRTVGEEGDSFIIPNDEDESVWTSRRIMHADAVLTTESATLGQLNTAISNLEGDIEILLDLKVDKSSVGEPNGVASLDATGKIPLSEIPDSIIGQVEYMGTWNAFTNTPTLNPLIPEQKGHYYVVSAAGVFGGVDYQVGDWIISNGVEWQKVDNTDAVTSVFGRIGAILALEADYQSFYPRLSQAYDNPTWINTLAFSKITDVPPFLLENQTITLSGDVTGSGKTSIASTISNNAVTDSKLRDSVGTSVIGRASSTTGDPSDIQASTDGYVLQRSGGTLLFGLISSDSIGSIDWSKIINTPTTLSGYGITNAYTKTEADNKFVPYTGANANVNLGSNNITANSFVKAGGTSAQFLKADGSVDVSQYVPTTRSVNAGTGLTGGGNLSSDITLAFDTTWGDTRYAYRTRQLTINGLTYDLSADRTWNVGTVTSVGLTMPPAFTVSNSPIIGSGTLNVVGAGTTSEYVRGDGSLALFPSLTGYVPYTGATQNVDLGEFGVDAGFVNLDTTPTNTPTTQGTIYWDDARSTAALIMNGTIQHIGQDLFFYVKNSSGSTIPKGTCVGFAGTDGASGHLLITPFLANGSVPSTYFMGVTSEEIANGSFGQVMHFGELEGINTSGFTAGALLYASTTVAGGFQTTVPVAPNNIILVAAAVNSKINGAIVVRPTLGSNINSDEGVKITSPTTGDLLQLQAGGLWENKTLGQVIGGTSSQFLKGDGSLDSTAYVPTSRQVIAGAGLTGGGALTANVTLSHADTSSQASVDNSNGNVIQDITLDTYGHITALGSTNLDSRYYTESEIDSTLTNYQLLSAKGQPNGYAGLDSNGKVPLAQINDALIGNVNFQGLWNAATNTPTLANPPAAGTKGYYYIVSTAGTFAGISFEVGDWIISNGSAWGKVDNTDAVSSVFGRTGNVTASNGDYNTSQVTESGNLYYTEARVSANTDVAANTAARHAAVTLGTANGLSLNVQQLSLALASGSTTGALSSANWTTFNNKENAIAAGTTAQYYRGDKTFQTLNTAAVPELTNLYYTEARVSANTDVAANTAARHAAVTLGTANGLGLTGQELSLGLASSSANGALSSTDWTTFNNKQNALTNPVTGTGTTNYLPKFTGTSTIGNSIFTENGGNALRIIAADANIRLTGSREYLLQTVDADGRFRIYDQTAQLERVTLTSTGSVGIGTTAPLGKIHSYQGSSGQSSANSVANGFIVEDNQSQGISILTPSTNEGNIFFGDESDNFIGGIRYYHTDDSLTFTANNAERLRITSTGNVGIGTNTPDSYTGTASTRVLAVGTTSGNNGVNVISGTTSTGSYMFSDSGGNDRGGLIYFHTADLMTLNTAGSERMRITSGGNVGINENNPVSKLQITSTLNSTGYTSAENLSGATNLNLYQILNGNTSTDNNGESGILISQTLSNAAQWGISVKRTNSFVGDLIFRTRTASTTSAERWRITSAGILQSNGAQTIQTSTGNLTLSTAAGNGDIVLTPNGTGIALIQNSVVGNIARFLSNTANGQQLTILSTATGVQIRSAFSTGIAGSFEIFASGGSSTLSFGTASVERMLITSTGNVGIGITPASTVLLDLKEPDAATDLIIGLTAGTGARSQIRSIAQALGSTSELSFHTVNANVTGERLRITSEGNVLIGTTTDNGARMQVSGTATVSGNGFFGGATTFSGLDGGISVNGASNSGINFRTSDVLRGYVYTTSNNMWVETVSGSVILAPNGSPALTLASTGAATFSSNVNLTSAASVISLQGSSFGQIFATNDLLLDAGTSKSILLRPNNSTVALTLASTGAATFSSSVTSQGGIFTAQPSTGTNGTYSAYLNDGGQFYVGIDNSAGSLFGKGAYSYNFFSNANRPMVFSTDGTTRLTIAGTGEATFSSSVTAASLISASATFSNFGSETAAVVAFADGNTGFFRPALNTLGITTAGTERMRITSTGNVLIGSPPASDNGARLQVSGTASISATNGYLYLNAVNFGGNESGIFFQIGGSNKWEQYTAANDSRMVWYSYASSSVVASLSTTGAATFSSSVTASGGVNAGDSKFFNSVQLTDSLGGTCQGFLWTDAANTLKIGTGTVAGVNVKMTITSSGNVWLGNDSNPLLEIANGGSTDVLSGIRWSIGGARDNYGGIYSATSSAYNNYISFYTRSSISTVAERMRITSTGNVLIGTTTDNGARLQVSGDILPVTDNTGVVGSSSFTWSNGQFTNLTVDSTMTVTSTLNVRAAIDLADSDVLRFGSSDDAYFVYDGTSNFFELQLESAATEFRITDNGTSKFTFAKSTGNLTATGTVTASNFITTSDRRLKTEIKEIKNAISILSKFASYEYVKDGKQDAGFIAQEVKEVIPYSVFENNDDILTMSDRPILAYMHKAILELNERINKLEK